MNMVLIKNKMQSDGDLVGIKTDKHSNDIDALFAELFISKFQNEDLKEVK